MDIREPGSNNDSTIKKKIGSSWRASATVENILETSVGFIDSFDDRTNWVVCCGRNRYANAILNVYIAVFIALGIGTSSGFLEISGAGDSEKQH